VQGVGFRYTVVQQARQRGAAGWVANRPDGSVEAVFEGDEETVARLVQLCSDGPRGAHVESVDVIDEPSEDLIGFEVH
jgi:acylphosphatase